MDLEKENLKWIDSNLIPHELKICENSTKISGCGLAITCPKMPKDSGIYYADFFIKAETCIGSHWSWRNEMG